LTPTRADALAVEVAPAKVNLYLHVLGRRPDGYHFLDSVAVFAGVADVLRAMQGEELSLTVGGPFATALAQEPDNLVLRAARALGEAACVPAGARLVLEKHLPVASGMGGGSADAAAALRLLTRVWGLKLDQGRVRAVAARLGADVTVCLDSCVARMGGVGEVLSEAPAIPRCGMLLVNPGIEVPTPLVFRARQGDYSRPADLPALWADPAAMADGLARCANDLEPPAVALWPVIGEVLAALRRLPGCLLARMSGSGATCFALFADPAAAMAAVPRLRESGWWSWGGPLHGGFSGVAASGAGT
jgi:4-diphosphocytidyl-2-C-methyl-D-erythritol kinase